MINLTAFRQHRAVRATGLTFFGSGLIFGTWAALIPYIKLKYGLDEAQLGLLLLCPPAGIVLANPLSLLILARFGAIRTALGVLAAGALVLILPIALPGVWLVAPALLGLGACMAILNIAMNTCASLLEQHAGVRIFSTCHGLWSTGAMAGAAIAGMATGWGIVPALYVSIFALLIINMVWGLRKPLGEVPEEMAATSGPPPKASGFALPNKALWLLIVIGLCTNLTEGTLSDWAAVFMREVVGVGEAFAAWGFATYALFMAGGRFLGDEIIARLGARKVLRLGGVIAVAGLLPAVFWHHPVAVLAGFAMVGAGVSLGAPILYASAARVPGMAKGAGLATLNTFAMVSFLGGPALIGFLAKLFSLPAAFGLVAILAGVWIWKAGDVDSGA